MIPIDVHMPAPLVPPSAMAMSAIFGLAESAVCDLEKTPQAEKTLVPQ